MKYHPVSLQFSREYADVSMIRYRDLLTDPKEVIREICRRHGISKRWFAGSLLPQVPQSEEFSSEKRQNYLRKDYMAEFSPETLSDLNRRVDMNLVRSLGYL